MNDIWGHILSYIIDLQTVKSCRLVNKFFYKRVNDTTRIVSGDAYCISFLTLFPKLTYIDGQILVKEYDDFEILSRLQFNDLELVLEADELSHEDHILFLQKTGSYGKPMPDGINMEALKCLTSGEPTSSNFATKALKLLYRKFRIIFKVLAPRGHKLTVTFQHEYIRVGIQLYRGTLQLFYNDYGIPIEFKCEIDSWVSCFKHLSIKCINTKYLYLSVWTNLLCECPTITHVILEGSKLSVVRKPIERKIIIYLSDGTGLLQFESLPLHSIGFF